MTALSPSARSRPAVLVRAAVVAALVAVGATVLGAGAAIAAGDDVSWTVRTDSNHFGDDRTSFSYNVNPGGQVEDALVVANHGKEPLTLGVFTADGYTSNSGQFDLVTKDLRSVGVGAWVRADHSSVTVQPGGTARVPFTVSVPKNATPGDHAGGILTSLVQADSGQTVTVDRRLGIKLKLRIGGDLRPSLAVENLHVTYAGSVNPLAKGDATLSYTVHNTGNAILSAKQAGSVAGPFGWWRAEAADAGSPPELLPGESWKMSVSVSGVAPAARLTARATLTPLIVEASGSTSSLTPVVATTAGWAISWTLLVLIVAVITLLVGGPVLVRRNRARRTSREDQRVQDAVELALREKGVDQLT